MHSFYITTLGCKVNQYESQQFRQILLKNGLREANCPEEAGLAIVKTCCVTHMASSKSRQAIRRQLRLNPDCIVIAAGCLVDSDTDEQPDAAENLVILHKDDDLNNLIAETFSAGSFAQAEEAGILENYGKQTRAFLKVQDGCNGRCTYCIIPSIRNIISSKPVEEAVREAENLISAGHKEIVLTGVFLGAYGCDTVIRKHWPEPSSAKFIELVDAIASLPKLQRLRLSSIEPGDITGHLLDLFDKHPNIAPHLHLPLQAGSDRVLKLMCRQYNRAEFIEKANLLKGRLDSPSITTDIIVGFPGETEEDFAQTIALCEEVGFSKIHVFSYSARKGTPATRMRGAVHSAEIKRRSTKLSAIGKKLSEKYIKSLVGRELTVIMEDKAKQRGKCERYLDIKLKNSNFKRNDIVRVQLLDNRGNASVL
ncbi:MAG: tRNA (N(6)-L-threonylcarbamoyladenosine(37)-C(2))-methylthiotransferase MtaB [Phycisphaerae bacterium]|jgi:threonylcarbamoyladenosine tRNA methylthiotransferase MtaB